MTKLKWRIYLTLTFLIWGFLGGYVGVTRYHEVVLPTAIALLAWTVFHFGNLIIWAVLDAVYLERGKRINAIRAETIRYLWDGDLSHYHELDRQIVRQVIDAHLDNLIDGKIQRRKP